MSKLPIIELCISLMLVFFVLSVMVSAIGEVVNTVLSRRSKLLEEAIKKAFNQRGGTDWGSRVYQNALIDNLKRKAGKLPSYISSGTFYAAFLGEILKEYRKNAANGDPDPGKKGYAELVAAVGRMNEGKVKELLTTLLNESPDAETFKALLCKWYDEYMERVTGWFARRTKIIIALIASVLVIFLNIDTIRIAKEIWSNEALRISLVDQAEKTVANQQLAGELKEYSEIFKKDSTAAAGSAMEELNTKIDRVIAVNNEVKSLHLPIGWKDYKLENNPYNSPLLSFLQMLLGWVITAFALTAGAPFWFRALGKLVNLRNTGVLPPTP